MSDEFCPECGAKITGNTGFCSECGAVTTSLQNSIDEAKNAEIEAERLRKEQQREKNEAIKQKIIKNKKWIIIGLIIIIAIPLIIMALPEDTSNHVYSSNEFTLEYPHNYTQEEISENFYFINGIGNGVEFHSEDGYAFVHIFHFDSNGMSLEDYLKSAKKELVESPSGSDHSFYKISKTDKIKVDGIEAYRITDTPLLDYQKENDECIIFIKDGECYLIFINFLVEKEYRDTILNSFKFN